MPNNSTTNGSAASLPVETQLDVQQGPAWLVDALYNPPGWLVVGLGLTVLVSVAVAFVSLYRSDWELRDDAQAEMLGNAAIIEGVLVATVLFVWYADYPYVVDAAGGFLTGTGVAYLSMYATRSRRGQRVIEALGVDVASRERFVAGWMLIAALGFAPVVLSGQGAVPLVFRGGLLLTGIGSLLTVYNAAVLSNGELITTESETA